MFFLLSDMLGLEFLLNMFCRSVSTCSSFFGGTASENLIWPIGVDANIFTHLLSFTRKALTCSMLRRIFFFRISSDSLRNHWLKAASSKGRHCCMHSYAIITDKVKTAGASYSCPASSMSFVPSIAPQSLMQLECAGTARAGRRAWNAC